MMAGYKNKGNENEKNFNRRIEKFIFKSTLKNQNYIYF